MGKKGKSGKVKKKDKAQRKAKKKPKTPAPKPVTTGKGASPLEVGKGLVEMFNDGRWREIEEAFWSPKVVSVEGLGVSLAWEGRKAVRAKNSDWTAAHTIHGAKAEGPFVGASGFAVRFSIDVEEKAGGKRQVMNEVGVYTLKNGKIVREEFMYGV